MYAPCFVRPYIGSPAMWYDLVFVLAQTIAPVHLSDAGIGAGVPVGVIAPPVIAPVVAIAVASGAVVAVEEDDDEFELPLHAAVRTAAAVRHAQKRTMLRTTVHLLWKT